MYLGLQGHFKIHKLCFTKFELLNLGCGNRVSVHGKLSAEKTIVKH